MAPRQWPMHGGGEWSVPKVLAHHRCLLSLQQKAHVSERELRYLWVLVSLNATESVMDVLLEDHPSWKYLQEVQTLLENVQQSLMVSCVCVLVV